AGLRRARELILWEANRIGMCLPQLVESRRAGGVSFAPDTVAWLTARFETDRARFDSLLAGGPFFHSDAPGAGDCAIWGYTQWLDAAGVGPSANMAAWLARMGALADRALPGGAFNAD
ncbi:hypothetical protein LCGC14_1987780, partial [marine sediment metagenome]